MKKTFTLFVLLALASTLNAQQAGVTKSAAAATLDQITGNLTFGAGKTLTATTGATVNLGNATVTLPATVSGGTSSFQPLDADLTAIAALSTTATGRSLLAVSLLTNAGLGITNGAVLDTIGAKAQTGTGNLVLATSPTLVTPTIDSVTAPASTALTLAGGTSGASLVLGQGTTAANITIAPSGTGYVDVTKRFYSSISFPAPAGMLDNLGTLVGPAGTGSSFAVNVPSVSAAYPSGLMVDGSYASLTSNVNVKAYGVLSGGGYGSNLTFSTSSNATLAEVARFTKSGNLLIGTTTDMTGSGGLKVAGTTAATTTTSGALIVAGGVGVSGAINAGGAGTFGGVLKVTDATGIVAIGSGTAISIWKDATPTKGAQMVFDSASNETRLGVYDGSSWAYGFRMSQTTGNVNVPATTSASSSTVGALTVGNGTAATNVAIGGGNVNAGGTLKVGGPASFAIAAGSDLSKYLLTDTGTSTTSLNGGLRLFSGAAYGIDLGYSATSTRYQTRVFTNGDGDIALSSATSPTAQSSFTDHVTVKGTTGLVSIASTSPSTGVGSGALQVAGGIYAGAASVFGSTVTAGGTLTVNNALANFGNGTAGVEVRASGDGSTTPYGYWWRSGGTYEASMQQQASTGVLTLDAGRNAAWGAKFDITVDTTRSVRFAKNLTTFDQPATFAGAVTVGSSSGITSAGNLTLQTATDSRINFIAGQTAWLNYNLAADRWTFRHTTSGVTSLTLTEAASTFAGAVITSSATLSGAGAIPITTSLVKFTSTAAANALTLANGVDGQRLTIVHDVKGTLGTGILTPTTKTGFSTITFTSAGDTVSLVYVTTRGWMVTGSYLATVAP